MSDYLSFGDWITRRRQLLRMTQADLAHGASCSLSMLRKIERDERRPSDQLAELLADRLAVDAAQRPLFLRMARGYAVADIPSPDAALTGLAEELAAHAMQPDEAAHFVGREQEMQRLHAHLRDAVHGQGHLLFIAGEAGRGKTSLLGEFARQALAAWRELLVAGGSSDVYTGQGDPLLPFRDVYRLLAGDIENAGLRGIMSAELARRVGRALPVTAQAIIEQGPHLLNTLAPAGVLAAHLARLDARGQRYAGLLLRLRDQGRERTPPTSSEFQQERLFEEISASLSALARHHPLLILLDDLQWADISTAALLGHLAQRMRRSPFLAVVSFRPEDLLHRATQDVTAPQDRHPLLDVLSESQRLFGQNRIDLDHADADATLHFVNALVDEEPNRLDDAFRQELARLTEGNALFTIELLRDMQERGALARGDDGLWRVSARLRWEHMPARVEGVIEKRMARLSGEQRSILDLASVQGELFTAEVIARVRQIEPSRLAGLLSAGLDREHRLIREQGVHQVGEKRLSEYQFRHQLFQKYLYEQLSAAERMYLHEDVGNALEAIYAEGSDEQQMPAVQLARHFEEARMAIKASRYLLLAGEHAARVVAFEEAIDHLEHGLALLRNVKRDADSSRLEFELTLALARAYWHSGRVAEAHGTYGQSIELARSLHEADVLARAVLAYEEPRWRLNLPVEAGQQYMREALGELGETESGLRVRLLVCLARALLASAERDELHAIVQQALDMARRVNDPVALCDALRISCHIDRRPETISDRLAAVEEMLATARRIDDQERLADAYDMVVYDQLELGNIEAVDAAMAEQRRVAEAMKQPFQLHIAQVFETMRALLRGEFETAERSANEAAEISGQLGIAELDGILGIHMFTIRAEQGRLREVAPIVKLYAQVNPASATWRPGLALIYAATGERAACRAVFDELATDNFAAVPRDSMWVTSLAYLTEACVFLGDGDAAAALYDLLLPYAERTVVAGGATACYGAAARYLGMLATVRQEWEAAQQHFVAAQKLDGRMGARPWLAHDQVEYAAMLLARGVAADRQEAGRLLEEADRAACAMGMAYLCERIALLQTEVARVTG